MGMCCCIEAPPLSSSPLVDYAELAQPSPVTPLRQLEQQRHHQAMEWQPGPRELAAYVVTQFEQPPQSSLFLQPNSLPIDPENLLTAPWLQPSADLFLPAPQAHDQEIERLAREFGQFNATSDLFGQPCPICMDELQMKYVTYGFCRHAMHWTCLKELLSHAEHGMPIKCPTCRRDYVPNNSES